MVDMFKRKFGETFSSFTVPITIGNKNSPRQSTIYENEEWENSEEEELVQMEMLNNQMSGYNKTAGFNDLYDEKVHIIKEESKNCIGITLPTFKDI